MLNEFLVMLSSKTGSTLSFLTPWKRLIRMSPGEASTMGDLCRECETKPLLFQSNHFCFFVIRMRFCFILMLLFVVSVYDWSKEQLRLFLKRTGRSKGFSTRPKRAMSLDYMLLSQLYVMVVSPTCVALSANLRSSSLLSLVD